MTLISLVLLSMLVLPLARAERAFLALAADPAARDRVDAWLAPHGLATRPTPLPALVSVEGPALDAVFGPDWRARQPALPPLVARHLLRVIPPSGAPRYQGRALGDPQAVVYPGASTAYYGMPAANTPNPYAPVRVAIVGYDTVVGGVRANYTCSPADLAAYITANALNVSVPVDSGAGPLDAFSDAPPSAECTLDLQAVLGTNAQAAVQIWRFPLTDSFFLDFLTLFLALPDPLPEIVSISFALPEVDNPAFVEAVNAAALSQAAARNFTVVASSGDDGAPGEPNVMCLNSTGLFVDWPASSPYAVGVGATRFVNASGVVQEVAVAAQLDGFCSGGGFSGVAAGRGVPDVAMLGAGWAIQLNGSVAYYGGTSLSAPLFAALLSRLQEPPALRGRDWLAQVYNLTGCAGCVNDVVQGNNACTTEAVDGCPGYLAGVGWDPVTGVGSLDCAQTQRYLLAAPLAAPPPAAAGPPPAAGWPLDVGVTVAVFVVAALVGAWLAAGAYLTLAPRDGFARF